LCGESCGAVYHVLSDKAMFCSNYIKYVVLLNSLYDQRFLSWLIARSLNVVYVVFVANSTYGRCLLSLNTNVFAPR